MATTGQAKRKPTRKLKTFVDRSRVGKAEKLAIIARRLAENYSVETRRLIENQPPRPLLPVPGYVEWNCTLCGRQFQERREYGKQSWCPACKRGDGRVFELECHIVSGAGFSNVGPIGEQLKSSLRKRLKWKIKAKQPSEREYFAAFWTWLKDEWYPAGEDRLRRLKLTDVLARLTAKANKPANEKTSGEPPANDTKNDNHRIRKKIVRNQTAAAVACGEFVRKEMSAKHPATKNEAVETFVLDKQGIYDGKRITSAGLLKILEAHPTLWKQKTTKKRH
jgi:hypothetical protein